MNERSIKLKKSSNSPRIKESHALQWVFDFLEMRPGFYQKRMFGCLAGYLDDRLVLVIADGEEPWNGILVPTFREFHAAIQSEFPNLMPHSVLGKWLYLSQGYSDFEAVANRIVEHIQVGDPRFGVVPKAKKRRKS